MLMKRPQHRIFDYEPRFYKPGEDPGERRKKKLGFRRSRRRIKKGRNPLFWLIVFIIVLLFYLKFIRVL